MGRIRLAWRLSPQVYAWGQALRKPAADPGDLPAFLLAGAKDAAAAGYEGIEVGLSVLAQPGRAARVTEALAAQDLVLAALFATLRLGGPETARREIVDQAAAARPTGCSVLNLATLDDPRSPAPDGAPGETARLLAELGPLVSEQGMRLCWHPHEEHLRHAAAALRAILDATPAEHVSVCLDLGWVARAGEDPVRVLELCGPRLGAVHLRDVRDGAWCEAVGDGDLDLDAICAALLRQRQTEWAAVELWFDRGTKVTRPLLDNAIVSLQALRRPDRLGAAAPAA